MSVRVDFNTGTTANPVWADISSFMRSFSYSRGRDDYFSSFSAGSCSIVLDNRGRQFDPTNTGSPYAGSIVPRREVRIFDNYDDTTTATRNNLVLNPSLEYGVAQWSTGTTRTTAQAMFGTHSAARTGTLIFINESSTPQGVARFATTTPLTANTVYTFSFYARQALADAYSFTPALVIDDDYGSGTATNQQYDMGAGQTPPADAWQRYAYTFTTPNNVGSKQTVGFVVLGGEFGVSRSIYFDGLMVEAGRQLNTYFDGDSTDTALATYSWTGVVGESVSTVVETVETGHQFVGYINDWDLSYSKSTDSTASIKAADGFTLLANQVVPDQTMPVEQSGVRLQRLLNEPTVLWSAPRRIDAGRQPLGADVTENAGALEYFQRIEQSEGGRLFVGSDGGLVFRSGPGTNLTLPVAVAFSDSGPGVRFEEISVVFGTEQLANQVRVTYNGGQVVANAADSQAAYGIAANELTDLLMTSGEDAEYLASAYVGRFGEPVYRIEEISLNLAGLSASDRAAVVGLELGDVVSVSFSPNGGAIEQFGEVVRIARAGTHTSQDSITFGIDTGTLAFVLNDSTLGVLDGSAGRLGF